MNELGRQRTTLTMNQIGKSITGITLGALIGHATVLAIST
jgi:hypothetical protein